MNFYIKVLGLCLLGLAVSLAITYVDFKIERWQLVIAGVATVIIITMIFHKLRKGGG